MHICKDINGNECIPLHIWVAQYGTVEDQNTHDNPDPTNIEKINLINRYYTENNVHSIEEIEDGLVIKTQFVKDLQNVDNSADDGQVFKFKYLKENGEICQPFNEWVYKFCNEEEIRIHNSPDDTYEKGELYKKYIFTVGATKMELYMNDVLIEEVLIREEFEELEKLEELQ